MTPVYLKEGHVPLQSVIFDIGRVLVNYRPMELMKKLGISPEIARRLDEIITLRKEFDEYERGVLSHRQIRDLAVADEPGLEAEIDLYMDHWEEQFYPISYNVETFYQIKEAGLKVYFLSNWMEKSYLNCIAPLPFVQAADGALISYQVKLIKPEPEIFHLLLDTYGIDPKTALFIDDLEPNIKTAKSIGLNVLHLPDSAPIADYLEFEN